MRITRLPSLLVLDYTKYSDHKEKEYVYVQRDAYVDRENGIMLDATEQCCSSQTPHAPYLGTFHYIT
jgi:hypothetical protein